MVVVGAVAVGVDRIAVEERADVVVELDVAVVQVAEEPSCVVVADAGLPGSDVQVQPEGFR